MSRGPASAVAAMARVPGKRTASVMLGGGMAPIKTYGGSFGRSAKTETPQRVHTGTEASLWTATALGRLMSVPAVTGTDRIPRQSAPSVLPGLEAVQEESGPTDADRVFGAAAEATSALPATKATTQAASLIDRLKTQLDDWQLHHLPPIEIIAGEDGSVALEWFLPDRRLAFTLEPDERGSGWHFVSSIASGGVRAFGGSFEIDLRNLIAWTLLPPH